MSQDRTALCVLWFLLLFTMPSKTSFGSPEPSLTLHGCAGIISSLHFIEHGPLHGHLVSGSLQTTVCIWDLISAKRLITKFQCDEKSAKNSTVLWTHTSIRSPDELFVQTRDGVLHRWCLGGEKPHQVGSTSTGNQLSFCPGIALETPNLLCVPAGEVSSNTSGVGLLGQSDFNPVGLLYPEQNLGSPMRMVRVNDHEVLIAYENADLLLWDVRHTSRPIFKSDIIKTSRDAGNEDDATPLALDMDRDKGIITVGCSSSVVKRFKLGPGEPPSSVQFTVLDSVYLAEPGVADLKIRPDGKIFTVASWDFTARVFSWKTLKPLAVLDLHRDTVQCVEYARILDANCIILGGKDAMISLWPLY